MTWQTVSETSEQTEKVARQLGKALKGGETIELVSDLGGGKTTFVRGLAHGAGSKDKVASPTFTINKVYEAPKFTIDHFDFYRLAEPGIMADELSEVVGDPMIVTVVEWADSVQHVLPAERLTVTIKQKPTGERELHFKVSADLKYLLEAVQ
jgi:tRNA threonylcarbamoyladenosine biosynthesis protein TsaE